MKSKRAGVRWQGNVEDLEARDLLALVLTATTATVASEPFSGTVAMLSDTNSADTPASFTTVTINWGDGSAVDTLSGHVVQTSNPGIFEVDGTHTFAKSGTFNTQVAVTYQNVQTVASTGTIVVPASPLTISPNSVTGIAKTALSASNGNKPVPVAIFIDPNTSATASMFSALVAWGDGQSSPGSVTEANGAFTITADHTYATAGSYTFNVTAAGAGASGSTSGQATIASPAPPASPFQFNAEQIVQPAGQPLVNAPVATFTDSNSKDAPSTLTASINWGDGGSGKGTVTQNNGVFTVSGSYTYAVPGTYTVTVTVQNQAGQSVTGTSTAVIVNTDTVSGSFAFSIGLAPLPANGPGAASGSTNTDRPTFSGTAPPFAIIQLNARRIDVDAPLNLGQTIANGSGQWSLTTGPLADGVYDVTATVTPPGGSPQELTNPPASSNPLDQFVVDTAPPRVVAVSPLRGGGQVLVTLRPGLSGLNLARLLDSANYTFTGPRGISFHPLSVTLQPASPSETTTDSVVLTVGNRNRARRLAHTLAIDPAAITSGAGDTFLPPGDTSGVFPLAKPLRAAGVKTNRRR